MRFWPSRTTRIPAKRCFCWRKFFAPRASPNVSAKCSGPTPIRAAAIRRQLCFGTSKQRGRSRTPARAQQVRSRCSMTWSDFYLFCFVVGFALSVLSFLARAVHIHLPFRLHLPVHGGHHVGSGTATSPAAR